MQIDIREKTSLTHEDVADLNFIRDPARFVFRRHFRSGLRSHIMELLDPEDTRREKEGYVAEGIRWFPRAAPRKMLRIFRTRFSSRDQALEEIRRVKIVEGYLGADFLAVSEEFLVQYDSPRGPDILLCGLQEYVQGEPLDPWRPALFAGLPCAAACACGHGGPMSDAPAASGSGRLAAAVAVFVEKVKVMMREAGVIPDLAGIRNLLATPTGKLKLVDINNISRIAFSRDICMDDKGYPVCDKSVEALYLLETKVVGKIPDPNDEVYAYFLTPDRCRRVEEIHRRFHRRLTAGAALRGISA